MTDRFRQSRRHGSTATGTSLRRGLRARLEAVPAGPLWALTLGVVLADLTSTVYGLGLGLREQNPVVAEVLAHHGTAGLVGLKILTVSWAALAWLVLDRHYGVAVLIGLAIPQGSAVAINVLTILALLA